MGGDRNPYGCWYCGSTKHTTDGHEPARLHDPCTNCDHGTDPKTLTTCNECGGTGTRLYDQQLIDRAGQLIEQHARNYDGSGIALKLAEKEQEVMALSSTVTELNEQVDAAERMNADLRSRAYEAERTVADLEAERDDLQLKVAAEKKADEHEIAYLGKRAAAAERAVTELKEELSDADGNLRQTIAKRVAAERAVEQAKALLMKAGNANVWPIREAIAALSVPSQEKQ